ncbi:MAG TPA: AI-2E family transporter [Tepidisphaeraceae bacterium]|jgi:predicted PurR-regulated permease PerM|nr:AI-2E family transporter [Tepidisphaeraceae bacterium]
MPDASSAPIWVRRLTTLFVFGVCFTFFIIFFNALTTVLLGVLAAAIVACALDPFLRYLPGPRGLSAGIIGLTLIAAVAALVLALSLPLAKPFQRQFENWPQSKASIDALLRHWSNRSHLEKPMSSDELLRNLSDFFAADRASLLLADVRDAVLAVLLWLAFVFVGSIFLLASPRDILLSPVLRAIPPRHRADIRQMLDTLGSRLRWWMIGALGGMCVVFTASGIGYSIARLKFALPLALLAGLAEMVPTIGPAVAAIIATLFAASQSSGAVVGVVITYTIIQSLEAYLILPLIMRGAVKIHPAITLFSVVLWAKIFGLPGLMLAIPINLTIGSAIEYLYVRPREREESRSLIRQAELAETQ